MGGYERNALYITYIVFDFEHHMAVAGGRMWWKDLIVLRVRVWFTLWLKGCYPLQRICIAEQEH